MANDLFREWSELLKEEARLKRLLRREIITLIFFLIGFGILWSIEFKLALGVYLVASALGREIKRG